jgi:hypothetical protein
MIQTNARDAPIPHVDGTRSLEKNCYDEVVAARGIAIVQWWNRKIE